MIKHYDDIFIEPKICEIPANGCYSYDNWLDNARLISAAPDLLEACKEVRFLVNSIPTFNEFKDEPWFKRLNDAINKATEV
jgi:hypothetical protein